MRGAFKSAIAAGVITETSLGVVAAHRVVPVSLFPWLVLPAQPGFSVMLLLGVGGGGPEGFPAPTDVVLHVITFLLWWPTLELVRVAWGRYRARRSTRPMERR